MRMVIAAFALLLPGHAFADCSDPETLLKQAYPDAKSSSDGLIVAGEYAQRIVPADVACKVWPFKPDLTLMAVPLIEADPAEEGESNGDVEVIVTDSKTGKPLARRREKGMAFGDAVQFTGVKLDTARYDMMPGIRAFGVVTRQFGSSNVNPYSESALWLYSFSDDRIDRVLDGLVIATLNGEYDGNCAGTINEISRTVDMAAAEHQRHRDLTVTEIATTTTSVAEGEDCKSTDKSDMPKQLTLQFDGGHYHSATASGDDGLFSYIEIGKDQ